jgi:two-component sensor histidine kinase
VAAPRPSAAVIRSRLTGSRAGVVTSRVREEVVPVVHDGRPIAVMSRHANVRWARAQSQLELNYAAVADQLVDMVAHGEYLMPVTDVNSGTPRVGDGLIRTDADGKVLYVSPNGLSCFHRLGILDDPVGHSLIGLSVSLSRQEVAEVSPLLGKEPWRMDVESNGVTVAVRGLPLTDGGQLTGSALLCREVSELRRRERELVAKEATIREVNHRVKNNLQTLAALLRIQLRRMSSPDVRSALAEAMRRVSTIAMVHETLTQTADETVDFDDVVRQTLRLAADVTARESQVATVLEGTFGQLCSRSATALALVLTELVSNAVEHGFDDGESGTVRVIVDRDGDTLRVEVVDDGRGLTEASGSGVGTQIVSTLVANDLDGSISWQPGPTGGTSVVIQTQACFPWEATAN